MVEGSTRARSSAFLPVASSLFTAQNFFLSPSTSTLLPSSTMIGERLPSSQQQNVATSRQCNLFTETGFETSNQISKTFEQGLQTGSIGKSSSTSKRSQKIKRSTSFTDSDFDDISADEVNIGKGSKRMSVSQSPGMKIE